MLRNASIYIRFLVTLILTVALAFGFRPLSKKLSQKTSPRHPLAEQELIGLGIVPLLVGSLLDSVAVVLMNVTLPFLLISAAALVGWGLIAFHWEPKVEKCWKVVLFHNLIPAVMFVLVCVQQLWLGRWMNVIGGWSQMFFLPVISLGFRLTGGSGSMFPGYCVSFVLMLLASFVGCRISRRKRGQGSHRRSMPRITGLLLASVMGIWLVSMACLTLVTAQELYDQMYERSQDYASEVSRFGLLHEFYDDNYFRSGYQYERPEFLENQIFSTIDRNVSEIHHTGGAYDYNPATGEDRNKLIRNISFPMETAVLFYDAEGRLMFSSEDDIMYFPYFTQEEWDAGMDTTYGLHYGWMDISEGKDAENWQDDPWLRFRTMYANNRQLMDIAAIRVKGYFEGTQLVPVVLHYVTDTQIWPIVESEAQFSTGPSSWSWINSEVDRTGKLEWQLQFDRSGEYEGKELVTVYLDDPEMWDYQGKALDYKGREYESLVRLTEALELPRKDSVAYQNSGIFELDELLMFSRWKGANYGRDYISTGETTVDFIMVTAIRSNPLLCAVRVLRNIYIVTGLLALVLLLTVRSALKKRLVQPVADVAEGMKDGWTRIYHPENAPIPWDEAKRLTAGYELELDRRYMKDNEITRLKTALDYARTAEQNRRQMTSNIAHELKTPLAVIHSYAEGLKERIAEDKREQYLDIILSETERTDAMVLEMLDLSRLEAGKVKLARDEFSLAELTKAVFEKLEMTARTKGLQICYEFPEESSIVADENRIGQVVENFASNAVKYTPDGGKITVRIRRSRGKTTFTIENDSVPLSPEALSKVWDSFYRTDESRSGGGTGLGLAIAKNIVELHGGSCTVRNTEGGVEFGFTI